MGSRGPAPKRADQRLGHRSKDEKAVDVPAVASVEPPALTGRDTLHPRALAFWDALVTSAEAEFYTAALWQRAATSIYLLDQVVRGEATAAHYTALQADWKALLVDAAEQRRLGIEVAPRRKAPADPDEERATATVLSLVDRLSG